VTFFAIDQLLWVQSPLFERLPWFMRFAQILMRFAQH